MSEPFQHICQSLAAFPDAPAFSVVNPTGINPDICRLLIDSRNAGNDASGTLFFAIRTLRNDGHRYVADLYARGVRAFAVSTDFNTAPYPDAAFILTEHPEMLLQALGSVARRRKRGKVVAITGSRGKTHVKEWLAEMLAPDFKVARSPRSYNSSIGVPLSLWMADDDADFTFIEAGISQAGEMSALRHIIEPDVAVITDISDAHADGFSSPEAKIAEKLLIACNATVLVYPSEAPGMATTVREALRQGNLRPDVVLVDSSAIARTLAEASPVQFAPWEQANMATCIAVLSALGIAGSDPTRFTRRLRRLNTRLNVVRGVNNCRIILDDYTLDAVSLAPAIDFARSRLTDGQRLTLVAADIHGVDSTSAPQAYAELVRLALQKGVSRIIGIGPNYGGMASMMPAGSRTFSSPADAVARLTPSDFNNEIILVEGSADANINKLVHSIEARTHETVLEVNLDALVENLNFYRSRLRPSTGVVAMVKASGYGAGSYELAKTLQSRGASYLAVAVLDEGIELRQAGITMPIMVLNPKVLNYPQLFSHRLEPEIYDFDILDEIIAEASKLGVADYPIHIKLDTGMHRLGFLEDDIPELIARLKRQRCVRVSSVFSHLATADCLDMDDYTLRQLDTFSHASSLIVEAFPALAVKRHILNTAGIVRFPQYQFDMVRLGIGLYGVPVLRNGSEDALRQVSTLRSPIISLKTWEAGTTIGYSRRGLLKRRSVIATVPVGYADGIDRRMGCGTVSFLVNGVKCPTVGNICMDLLMLDVTDANASVGDSVLIFGEQNPATLLADAIGTIPYEILTSVSPRVPRLYFAE